MNHIACGTDQTRAEIQQRFGEIPTFFSLAFDTPDVASQLWQHANQAYLENPIPFLFKERLFVYLSRFCQAKYCVVRHAAMLLGSKADANANDTVSSTALGRDENLSGEEVLIAQRSEPWLAWPDAKSEVSQSIFDCCVAIFLRNDQATKCQAALRRALGVQWYQRLAALMSFIRTALEWTEWHPDLRWESDIEALIQEHQDLADWFATHSPEAVMLAFANDSHRHLLSTLRSEFAGWNVDTQGCRGAVNFDGDDAMFLADMNREITFCNPAFSQVFGYRAEELIGQPMSILYADQDEYDRQAQSQFHADPELRGKTMRIFCRHQNGDVFPCEVIGSTICDARKCQLGYLGLIRDIREREQAAELVRQSEERLSLVES